MFIDTLLNHLNASPHVDAVTYMDVNFGPSNPFADKMEWLIDVHRNGHIEVATIKLVSGVFVVDSWIHRFMEIRTYDTLVEAVQRIELAMQLAFELNLN